MGETGELQFLPSNLLFNTSTLLNELKSAQADKVAPLRPRAAIVPAATNRMDSLDESDFMPRFRLE